MPQISTRVCIVAMFMGVISLVDWISNFGSAESIFLIWVLTVLSYLVGVVDGRNIEKEVIDG